MGGADIIPGVSGGTMALIVGIYKDLIAAIGDAFSAVLLLVRGRVSEAWAAARALDWRLLGPVALGILTAIGIGSLFVPEMLERYPVGSRALFFGLVAASLVIPWRERREHHGWHYAVAAVAAVVAFVLVGLPRSGDAADPGALRIAGTAAVAINAMILPGVSGAFLLEVFGLYRPTLEALRSLDVGYVATFALGAGVGLGLAAKGLSWLLDRYHDLTMTVLVGLLAGSLRALWPWVASVEHAGSDGLVERVPDPSVLLPPGPDWPVAFGLAALGFGFVTALTWVGRRRLAAADDALAHQHEEV
jgi:putative membrane protein